jgi:hypothetical protein
MASAVARGGISKVFRIPPYYVYRMVTSPKNEHNEKVRRDIQHLAWRPEAY